eukprot:TRINITY_DN10422_c0_g1_i2.p1 TRINITY_DN10422_c0_g1~~TRINITY_DN10422_c0_g1_i2.p1  ORF type:complete len:545 (-),score=93.83 TRINITY_DN10422_c0_g1_i2:16-1650(-)
MCIRDRSTSSVEGEGVTQDTFADLRTWLSIFSALSSLTSVREFSIRNDALVTLFATIRDHAVVFSSEDWDMILGGTVQPIFENLFCDIIMLEEEHRDMEHNGTRTAQTEEDYRTERKNQIRLLETGLDLLTALYIEQHTYLSGHLQDLLSILIGCTSKKDPQVTNAGLGKLQRILTNPDATAFLTPSHWDMIVKAIKDDVGIKRGILRKLEVSLTPAKVHTTTSTLHALVRYLMALGASLQAPAGQIPDKVVVEWMGIFMSCHKAVSVVLDTSALSSTINNLITGRIILDSQRESCKGLVLCFGRVPPKEQELMEEWVKNILRRLAALPQSNREFDVIHEAVVYLLKVMTRMPEEVFKSIALKTYGSLCALISSADPELCKYLSAIFIRIGCATNVYLKTSQDDAAINALLKEDVPSVKQATSQEEEDDSQDGTDSTISNAAETAQEALMSSPVDETPQGSPPTEEPVIADEEATQQAPVAAVDEPTEETQEETTEVADAETEEQPQHEEEQQETEEVAPQDDDVDQDPSAADNNDAEKDIADE